MTHPVRAIPAPMGLRAAPDGLILAAAIVSGTSFGYLFVQVIFAIAVIGVLARSRRGKDTEYQRFRDPVSGPAPIIGYADIRGLPSDAKESIESRISANVRVVIRTTSNPLVRRCLRYFVECRLGVVRFEEGGGFEVSGEPLSNTSVVLEHDSPRVLQRMINVLEDRGWVASGGLSVSSTLLSTSYGQRMAYSENTTEENGC